HLFLTDDFLKGELAKARKDWNTILKQDAMHLNYNGKVLTPLFITDMWINDAVHSYVSDPEKAAILKHMTDLEKAVMRPKFFTCIHKAIHIINYVNSVVSKALDEGLIDTSKTK